MRMARETKLFSETGGGGEKRRALSLIVLFLFTACALLMLFIGRRAVANTNEVKLAAQPVSSEPIASPPAQDYSRFSHSSPGAHAALSGRWSCSICHQRNDNSIEPKFPGHKACISCHQTQFNTPGSPF